jgi:hypothetical protein
MNTPDHPRAPSEKELIFSTDGDDSLSCMTGQGGYRLPEADKTRFIHNEGVCGS